MKKVFVVLFIAACGLQFSAQAQKSAAPKSVVGIDAGLTVANVKGPLFGLSNTGSSRKGYTVGMYISTSLGGNFTFQPEISYVQKGSNRTQVTAGQTQKVGFALRYAEVPLNFLYNLNAGSAKFFVGVGPYAAFNLSSKKLTGSSKAVSDIIFGENTGSEDMKGIDLGANYLAGIRLDGGFTVSFNYSMSIRNLASSTASQGSVKNQYFGVKLGYLTHAPKGGKTKSHKKK